MHAQQHAVEGAFADVHAGPCGSKGVALVGIFAGEVRQLVESFVVWIRASICMQVLKCDLWVWEDVAALVFHVHG